jgi:hypothetical protein
MMAHDPSFDWDKYISTQSYEKVLDGMNNARLIIPMMFSPDKKLIYLKTYDVAFETNDPNRLNIIFKELYESLVSKAKNINWSCEKLYLLEIDYKIIWEILDSLDALPDDYQYPEYYLQKVMNNIRPKTS